MGSFHIPPDLVRGPESDVLPLSGEANWGMQALGIDRLRSLYSGAGVTVCVVDTGASPHPLINGRYKGRSFVPGESVDDGNGHGTHCLGTVGASDPNIGVGTALNLLAAKGLSNAGSGAGSWIANGMQWGADEGAEVLSLSLGSSSPDPTIQAKCDALEAQGIWIVCAAGNSGQGTPDVDFPGRFMSVASVAALAQNLSPASFSSSGAKIDTSGPGVNIWSLKPGGGYAQMSGTSMATPWVAGCLAVYRSALKKQGKPIPRMSELRKLLFSRSTDTHTPGDDLRTGPGWIDPFLLMNTLKDDPV